MAFVDPWLARGQSSPIEYAERQYVHSNKTNPLHVWRAITYCSQLLAADVIDGYPDWIHEYLRGVADDIGELFYEHDYGDVTSVGKELGIALGFLEDGQGKRSSAFDKDRIERRDHRLAIEVLHYLQERNLDADRAFEAFVALSEDRDAKAAEYEHAVTAGEIEPTYWIVNKSNGERVPHYPDGPERVSEPAYRRAWERWGKHLMTAAPFMA